MFAKPTSKGFFRSSPQMCPEYVPKNMQQIYRLPALKCGFNENL